MSKVLVSSKPNVPVFAIKWLSPSAEVEGDEALSPSSPFDDDDDDDGAEENWSHENGPRMVFVNCPAGLVNLMVLWASIRTGLLRTGVTEEMIQDEYTRAISITDKTKWSQFRGSPIPIPVFVADYRDLVEAMNRPTQYFPIKNA